MTTTTEAAELILHTIQRESAHDNLKLNQSKCCLLRMNAIQTIQYEDGQIVPTVNQAVYLGTTITANGNYHAEISARITASMTIRKNDIFQNMNIIYDYTFSGTNIYFPKNENSEYTMRLLPRSCPMY